MSRRWDDYKVPEWLQAYYIGCDVGMSLTKIRVLREDETHAIIQTPGRTAFRRYGMSEYHPVQTELVVKSGRWGHPIAEATGRQSRVDIHLMWEKRRHAP